MINPTEGNSPLPSPSDGFSQEKPSDDPVIPETNPAQAYYDSIIRPDIDTSSMINVDEKQMKTDKDVSDILSRHIKNWDGWLDFNVGANMMLDPFLKNFPEEWTKSTKILAAWMEARSALLVTINQDIYHGKISAEEGLEKAQKLEPTRPDFPEHNLYTYGNYEWKTGEEAAAELPKLREQWFINTYQIDPKAVGTEAYQKALEEFIQNEDRVVDLAESKGITRVDAQYGGSLSEFLKGQVVNKGLSRREWLDQAQKSYDILFEHVNRDDFASRPPLAKKLLPRQLELAKNILEDMKAAWKYGDLDVQS